MSDMSQKYVIFMWGHRTHIITAVTDQAWAHFNTAEKISALIQRFQQWNMSGNDVTDLGLFQRPDERVIGLMCAYRTDGETRPFDVTPDEQSRGHRRVWVQALGPVCSLPLSACLPLSPLINTGF